jgi:hypothetical protein
MPNESGHHGTHYWRASRRGFCGLEVGSVEALGEPIVGRLEERQGISGTAPIGGSRARLVAARNSHDSAPTLPAGPVERLPEVILGRYCGSLRALR